MKDKMFKFDLQTFAEGDETPPATPPEGTPPTGGETPPATPPATPPEGTPPTKSNQDGTILGNKDNPNGTPETYDISSIIPEGQELDQQQFEQFSSIAKECGLTNDQANKLAKFGMEFATNSAEAVTQAMNTRVQEWGTKAKTELGAEFQNTVSLAGAGLEALEKTIPNIRQALDETGAGNRVEIIRAMAMLGELTKEDGFRGFGQSNTGEKSVYDNTDFSKY